MPMLELAARILDAYGKCLAATPKGIYGIPESRLPYAKVQIRTAIRETLAHLDDEHPDVRRALIDGFVYLAQFIPDAEAEILRRGEAAAASGDTNHPDWASTEQAAGIINRIKLNMESALEEIKAEAGPPPG